MTPQDTKLQAALERLRGIETSPGPWRLVRKHFWIVSGEKPVFALLGGGGMERIEADAQLAALAPLLRDLLAGKGGALEILGDWCDAHTENCPCERCAFVAAATEALHSAMPSTPEG